MELRAAPAGGRRHSGEVWFSERQACRIVGQHRGSQRYTTIVRADEDALTRAIVSLALNRHCQPDRLCMKRSSTLHDYEVDRRDAGTPSLRLVTTTRRLISPFWKAFRNFS